MLDDNDQKQVPGKTEKNNKRKKTDTWNKNRKEYQKEEQVPGKNRKE